MLYLRHLAFQDARQAERSSHRLFDYIFFLREDNVFLSPSAVGLSPSAPRLVPWANFSELMGSTECNAPGGAWAKGENGAEGGSGRGVLEDAAGQAARPRGSRACVVVSKVCDLVVIS